MKRAETPVFIAASKDGLVLCSPASSRSVASPLAPD